MQRQLKDIMRRIKGYNEKDEDKNFQNEDHKYTPPPRRL